MHLNSSLLFLLLPLLLNASPNDAGKPVSGMVLPTNLEAAKQTFPVEPPLEDLPLRARQDEGSKEPLMYVATLPEPKAGDDPFVKETTEFFRVRSLDFDTNIVILTDWEDKVAAWAGIMPLNQTALGEIKSRKGIKEVFETSRGKRRLAMPKASRREVADLNTDAGFDKRAPGPSGWYKQEFTLDINSFNLKVVSQFAGQELGPDMDYVYEKHGGAKNGGGVFIYILETGIQLDARTSAGPEFPNVDRNPDGSVKVIQTVRSWNSGERPEVDEHAPTDQPRDQGSHGTRVASLALGATYGIAKHATLVSVKSRVIKGAVDDQSYALQLVLRDIIDNNRQNQAVVLSTIGDLGPSPRNAHETDYSAAWYHFGVFRELMKLGVPVITPSGNDRNGNSRAEIDFWPSMWASPEYPLIVVGETDHEGIRPPVSQAGPQVTTWAPGSGAICVARDGSVDASAGSSLAAAMVAGVVATFMAYDEEPWGTGLEGIERTKRIEQYFRSNDATGYKRVPIGERVLWNSADQAAHQSAVKDPNGVIFT